MEGRRVYTLQKKSIIIKRNESYLSLLCLWSIRMNLFVLIFSFSFLFSLSFFFFFLFRIIFIWFWTNQNLYFLDEKRSAGLLTCSQGEGICYGLFQKISKQVTEGWGHRFSTDTKLKKRTCGNSRGQLSRGHL